MSSLDSVAGGRAPDSMKARSDGCGQPGNGTGGEVSGRV
jgi:hypothetical protein